jgi:hypothetical protein
MHLRKLPTERRRAVWTCRLREIPQGRSNAIPRLIDHARAQIRCERANRTSTIRTAAREEAFKVPTGASNARCDHGCEERGCARDRNDADPCGDRRSHKLLSRVADQRSTSITDERHCLPRQESRDDWCDSIRFIKARERCRFCVDLNG